MDAFRDYQDRCDHKPEQPQMTHAVFARYFCWLGAGGDIKNSFAPVSHLENEYAGHDCGF